jgi:hypothetical protein
MNSSAFTVAVKSIVKEFGKTPTEASYLSKPSTLPIMARGLSSVFCGTNVLVASLQVLGMGFGAAFWVRFLSHLHIHHLR